MNFFKILKICEMNCKCCPNLFNFIILHFQFGKIKKISATFQTRTNFRLIMHKWWWMAKCQFCSYLDRWRDVSNAFQPRHSTNWRRIEKSPNFIRLIASKVKSCIWSLTYNNNTFFTSLNLGSRLKIYICPLIFPLPVL